MKRSGSKNKTVQTLTDQVKNEGAKKINFVVTADEHKAIKLEAIERGISLTDLMKKSLNEYLGKSIFM